MDDTKLDEFIKDLATIRFAVRKDLTIINFSQKSISTISIDIDGTLSGVVIIDAYSEFDPRLDSFRQVTNKSTRMTYTYSNNTFTSDEFINKNPIRTFADAKLFVLEELDSHILNIKQHKKLLQQSKIVISPDDKIPASPLFPKVLYKYDVDIGTIQSCDFVSIEKNTTSGGNIRVYYDTGNRKEGVFIDKRGNIDRTHLLQGRHSLNLYESVDELLESASTVMLANLNDANNRVQTISENLRILNGIRGHGEE